MNCFVEHLVLRLHITCPIARSTAPKLAKCWSSTHASLPFTASVRYWLPLYSRCKSYSYAILRAAHTDLPVAYARRSTELGAATARQ